MLPSPLEVRNVYAIQRPSGDALGRIQCSASIVERPVLGSHLCTDPAESLKNSRLGTEAQTPIVMPEVEYTSEPSLAFRTWSGAVWPVPPTCRVCTSAMYWPSGE